MGAKVMAYRGRGNASTVILSILPVNGRLGTVKGATGLTIT
jgi:hypothetical protein